MNINIYVVGFYMNLSPRLQCIARQIDNGAIVADIGTDHAYIPIYLVENKISPLVYASDIGKGPLKIANEQISKAALSEYIITLLGEGLAPITDYRVDNIIIAGMGGILIQDIISQNLSMALNADKLILQPMVAQEELRKFLINNGFKIIHEDLAKEDRRIYQIIVAHKGNMNIEKDIYYEIGYNLIEQKHPLLPELIRFHENKIHKIIKQCENKNTHSALKQMSQCEKMLRELKELEHVI